MAFRLHARQGGPAGGPGGVDVSSGAAEEGLGALGEAEGLGDSGSVVEGSGLGPGGEEEEVGLALGEEGEPSDEEVFIIILVFGYCSLTNSEVLEEEEGPFFIIDSEGFTECLGEAFEEDEQEVDEGQLARLQTAAKANRVQFTTRKQ